MIKKNIAMTIDITDKYDKIKYMQKCANETRGIEPADEKH